MKHMDEVGIRALKQNASSVVAAAASGRTITVTLRGRPVAALVPLVGDQLSMLIAGGRARPAKTRLAELSPPEPPATDGPTLSSEILRERAASRY